MNSQKVDHSKGQFAPDVKNLNVFQYFEGDGSDSFFL